VSHDAPITQLLQNAEAGEVGALDQVVTALYEDLRRRARSYLQRHYGAKTAGVTLQPTALVNETYLRLLKQRTRYADRGHFLAIATRVMLRVLADYQRARHAQKRGGEAVQVTLSGLGAEDGGMSATAADLADALERLEALDERKADVVRLRAIWGIEMREVADALGISLATAERDWRFARSWLADALGPPPEPS
jgi:RNA polymerase sigma factor (TIGR02999 family)